MKLLMMARDTVRVECGNNSVCLHADLEGAITVTTTDSGTLAVLAVHPEPEATPLLDSIVAEFAPPPPDFKAIADELFDALSEINNRLQNGLMGKSSGRLVVSLPELLERHECAVKDK